MRIRNVGLSALLDVLLTSFGGVLLITVTLTGNTGVFPVSAMLLMFVAVAPGYVLGVVLFPMNEQTWVENSAVSVGMSLAIASLGGLALHGAAIPLTATSWALFIGGITMLLSVVAAFRRISRGSMLDDRYREDSVFTGSYLRLSQVGLLLIAGVIVLGALHVSRLAANTQPTDGFTQLWALPTDSELQGAIQLGVRNEEKYATAYILIVELDGQVAWELSLTLARGEEWHTNIQIEDATEGSADVFLYLAEDASSVYRHVRLE